MLFVVVGGWLGIPLVGEERWTHLLYATIDRGGFSTTTGFGLGTLNDHTAVPIQGLSRFLYDALQYGLAMDCRGGGSGDRNRSVRTIEQSNDL